jgi:hypothetical protein
MSSKSTSIRIDDASGYLRLYDLYKHIEEGKYISTVWLRDPDTVNFILAWESICNPFHEKENYREIILRCGSNAFYLRPHMLIEAGACGVFIKQERWPMVYIHPDWAMQFANWISPTFYVESLRLQREYRNRLQNQLAFQKSLVSAFLREGSEEQE